MATMTDYNDVIRLGIDMYHGTPKKYSMDESTNVMYEALVAANNGKTYLDYRDIRDGKCSGLFSIIENILAVTNNEGFQNDEYFTSLVQYVNTAAGDKNEFVVEDSNLYVVAEAANGTQGIRRQRIGGVSKVTIPTRFRVVKLYDELNRILSHNADLAKMIRDVSESFRRQMLDDIYGLWANATANDFGGTTYFPSAGSYDEDALLDVIAHCEAAAGGKPATIIGTKKALRKLKDSIDGDSAKSDLYTMGYVGKFYGSNVVMTPQRHKLGTTDFVYDDTTLHIIAGDEKPIKVVREGNPLVIMGDPYANGDLTQNYMYGEQYGVGLVLAGGNSGIGRYKFTE